MHKTSVTFPMFDWQRDALMPTDGIACQGLTAKMHNKFIGGYDERSQSRRKESSLLPPISPRKISTSSSSSSKKQDDSSTTNNRKVSEDTTTPNFEIHEETSYLGIEQISNRSVTDKLGNMGHKLRTLQETKSLPGSLKPKARKPTTRKRQGQVKEKKKKIDGNDRSDRNGTHETADFPPATEEDRERERERINEIKYGKDWKRKLEWSITRPFTFSYFPQIHQKRKKNDAGAANGGPKKSEGNDAVGHAHHPNKY